MSLPDKLIRQIGDHTFGASVKTGRHTFDEGSNLRDLHGSHMRFLQQRAQRRGLRSGSVAFQNRTQPTFFFHAIFRISFGGLPDLIENLGRFRI